MTRKRNGQDSPPRSIPGGRACPSCGAEVPAARFMTLTDVAQTLNVSAAQTYALVRTGDLPAIKLGGRGQWRVEACKLEEFIARMYAETEASLGDE